VVAKILDEEEEEEQCEVIEQKCTHEAWVKRERGEFGTLYKELIDDTKFFGHFKISENYFYILLSKLDVH
jgi:hypothetical protein